MLSTPLRTVEKFERLFVPGRVDQDVGAAVENPNVMTLTVENRSEVARDVARMESGLRHVEGGMNVGKTTVFTCEVASRASGTVVVLEPSSALAANAAFSVNGVRGEDFSGAITSISPKYDAIGNLVFVDSGVLCYEYSCGNVLSSEVSVVIVDEWHSTVAEHAAAKELVRKIMKRVPVVTMTGTSVGRRTVHNFDNVKVERYTSVTEAERGKRIIYCESTAEAIKLARENQGERLSPFSSYSNICRLFGLIETKEFIDVYASYECSEGFNFPFNVVVDCANRLELSVHEGEMVLVRSTVTDSQHLQRAARLRSQGTYYGSNITKLRNEVLRTFISSGDEAMREWWKQKLGLPPGVHSEKTKTLLSYLNDRLTVDALNRARLEGRDWYEHPQPENLELERMSVSSSPRSSGEIARSRSARHSLQVGSPVGSSLSTILGVKSLTDVSGNAYECVVIVEGEKFSPDDGLANDYTRYYETMNSKHSHYFPNGTKIENLAAFVDARNEFVYRWKKRNKSKYVNILSTMQSHFEIYFERRLKIGRYGSVVFLYADLDKKDVYGSRDLFFLGDVGTERLENEDLFKHFVDSGVDTRFDTSSRSREV